MDISDPTSPSKVSSLAAPGANSVAVSNGLVAVARQADVKTAPGTVSFFDAGSLQALAVVCVGSLPDMVTFTPDGSRALVANEGEPEGYCPGQADPPGTVSIIDLRRGPALAQVATAGFTAYDGHEDSLRDRGIRIFGPGASASQDFEPEYIAASQDGKRAWVSLQENNAIATIDVKHARITGVTSLGEKDHSMSGRGLDPSDRDGGAHIATWPVNGYFMPDGIDVTRSRGIDYLVTANEGDAREYDCFEEETRVKDVELDPAAFPDADELQDDDQLGRLTVTTTAGDGPDGFTELHSFGARSLSVRAADGTLIWDSGDQLEQITAAAEPALFNADNSENDSADSRSDNKGPEPEGVDVGKAFGHTYAFVGLERTSGIAVYDITAPQTPVLAGYYSNRDADGDAETGTAGDLGPEGLHFVAADDSPTGEPLLLVGNEVSGTTTIWSVRR